jgi:hypothetical protein
MNEIDIRKELLLDFLDQSINGQLYPAMSENDDIVKVEITHNSIIFTIGETEESLIRQALVKAKGRAI